MEEDTLRSMLSLHLKAQQSPRLVQLGEAVSTEACWGALVQSLEHLCADDADYISLLHILIEIGDARALLLFFSAVRQRRGVLAEIVIRAADLPRTVQCALVTMREVESMLEKLPVGICAAARELVDKPSARASSEQVYAAHMGHLRSMTWGHAAMPA